MSEAAGPIDLVEQLLAALARAFTQSSLAVGLVDLPRTTGRVDWSRRTASKQLV